MTNSTVVPTNSQPVFNFGDNPVRVVVLNDSPWFVASDVWAALRLTNPSKAMKVLEPHERSNFKLGRQGEVNIVSESGLYTLILRCRDAIKPGTIAHQFKTWVTSEVLPSIRKTGAYERQAFAVNPGDVLTKDEAETLRLMLKTAADRLPKEKQGALMMQGWSKLKSHFKVSYREIPRHEFSEAVSIIARHAADWEVVDDGALSAAADTDKIKHAFALAAEVAKQAAMTVFNAVVDDKDAHKHDRWMFHMDWHTRSGTPAAWAKPIAHDSVVFSMNELPKRIVEPNSMIGTREELANVAMACMQKLSGVNSMKIWTP